MNSSLEYYPLDPESFNRLWIRIRHLLPAPAPGGTDGLVYAREALEANLPLLAQSLSSDDKLVLHGWLYQGRLERYERWLKFMRYRTLQYPDVLFAAMLLSGSRQETCVPAFQALTQRIIENRIPATGKALVDKWNARSNWKVITESKLQPRHFDLAQAMATGEGAAWLSGACISALAQKLSLPAGCLALGGKLTLLAESPSGLVPLEGAEPLAAKTMGYLTQSLQRSPKLDHWSAEPETILLAAIDQLLILGERHHPAEAEAIRKAKQLSSKYLRYIPDSFA